MPLHLQDRDFRALQELGEVGLMSSDQLFARHYSPSDATVTRVYFNRRMRDLAKADLIEKTDVVLAGNKGVQKQPSVFRLKPMGAEELRTHCGIEVWRVAKSDPPSVQTMLHRIGVTATLLAFKDAAKNEKLEPVRWLLDSDKEPDAKIGQARDKQFILMEAFDVGRDRYTCRPDASIALSIPKGDKTFTLLGYVEYDRSTEGRDQIQRTKLHGYSLLLGTKQYQNHWPGVENGIFRILFICRSAERIRNLQEWLGVSKNPEVYRFTLHSHLNEGILGAPVWWGINDDPGQAGLSILYGRKVPEEVDQTKQP